MTGIASATTRQPTAITLTAASVVKAVSRGRTSRSPNLAGFFSHVRARRNCWLLIDRRSTHAGSQKCRRPDSSCTHTIRTASAMSVGMPGMMSSGDSVTNPPSSNSAPNDDRPTASIMHSTSMRSPVAALSRRSRSCASVRISRASRTDGGGLDTLSTPANLRLQHRGTFCPQCGIRANAERCKFDPGRLVLSKPPSER